MRNKLKEFIVKRDLKISFLHNLTGVHKATLGKLINTNDVVKDSVLLKIEAKLIEIGFSRIDIYKFMKLASRDYATNCEDGVNYSIRCRINESWVRVKLCDIASIEYYPTDCNDLFCEVVFNNGSKLILKEREMEVFI